MVSLSEVRASNARIAKDTAPHTAIFTGATDGIGKATLTRLVSAKLPIKIYVIGRNGDKHKRLLDELRKSNDKADIFWLEGQISLLAEVQRLCDEIKARETSIDLLFMSAGFIRSGGREETIEGNEIGRSLCYYGRILFITQLLPLLNASSNNPRILSILAAGNESSSIPLDDLDLKKPENFGLVSSSKSAATHTTLSMLKLAQENPRVIFIHHYPGGVKTDLFKKVWGEKWWWWLFAPLLAMAGTSPEDAGEKAVYLLTSSKYGGKGVPLSASERPGLTMAKTKEVGSLFNINEKVQELYQEKVMADLNRMDAGAIVWRKTLETLKPYSS
ncbi:NAD(P)-binding protein [Rhizodiscina lignyota]|uniref:NAD(P)-binding protein n=1 Tax=Rhizodiscina lignyota TaxID=1504668 RepID=A0A9P4I4S5_9PEZI|nr:NAD(P)-binding protein [Rhizodiscina lignyota]